MKGCEQTTRFSQIVLESDPDCFVYNYARQGEFDLGLGTGWQAIEIPEGKTFLSFEDHKKFVEAKLNLLFVLSWEPDPELPPKEQATNFCVFAIQMLAKRHILWSDGDQVQEVAVRLIKDHDIGDELNDLIVAKPN